MDTTVTDDVGGAVTFSTLDAVTPLSATEMVDVPTSTPVATPDPEMVAIAGLLEAQLT